MAVDSNWTRKAPLAVDHTKVPSDQTDFAFPLIWNGTSGNLPAEVYNTSALSPKSDGSDIRFTSDSAGTTEIPFEIVTFSPNATVSSARVEIYVKPAALSSASDTTIFMWWGNPSASAYATTATYGRNNTWPNYYAVWHMNEADAIDSTGNGYTLVNSGTDAATTALGTAREFVASSRDYMAVTSLMGAPQAVSFFALVSADSVDTEGGNICTIGDNVGLQLNSAGYVTGFFYEGSFNWNELIISTDIRGAGLRAMSYSCKPATPSQRLTLNGGSEATDNDTDTITYDFGTQTILGIHGNGDTDYDFDGIIDEVRISSVERSANWMTTEYNSTIGFATFVTPGTPIANNTSSFFYFFPFFH